MASRINQGDSPSRSEVSNEPLAKSQMRPFMKELSVWILECKVWNAKCKLARAENAQAGMELVIKIGGLDSQQWQRTGPTTSAHPKGCT